LNSNAQWEHHRDYMKKENIIKLTVSLVVCQLAGVIGSLFTYDAISTWYVTLSKPFFTPPSWLFAPAWITLYFLMGISLYLVWIKGNKIKEAISVFGIQLALNITWSFAFFGLKNLLFGLINILVLWFAILVTIKKFYKIDKNAAYLLVPYLAWVTFATFLNYYIWVLN